MSKKSKLDCLKDCLKNDLKQELSEARADKIRENEVADMRIIMLEEMIERIAQFNGKTDKAN